MLIIYCVQRNETDTKFGDCKIRTNEIRGPTHPDHNLKTCYFVYCHSADILPCLFKFFFAFFLLIITKLQHKENKEKKVQVFLPLEKKREKKNETQTKKNSNTLFL